MKGSLFVGCGGFLGAIMRYHLGSWLMQWVEPEKYPVGTLVVNLVGCLVMGIFVGLTKNYVAWENHNLHLLFSTGLLGGFTTFSAFGLESVFLLQRGEIGIAIIYILSSVLGGLGAVWLGLKVL